jgi:hypothetical protein
MDYSMEKRSTEFDPLLYHERLTSNKTEALFLVLMLLCCLLFTWRVLSAGPDGLAGVLLGLFGMFFFYAVNYRTLVIQLTEKALTLTFGIFIWKIPVDNIAACQLDDIPPLLRLGGAGIHLMFVRRRYRASFNFLEFPRVVITFRRKVGPVQDISFTTRQPDDVIRLIRKTASENQAAR